MRCSLAWFKSIFCGACSLTEVWRTTLHSRKLDSGSSVKSCHKVHVLRGAVLIGTSSKSTCVVPTSQYSWCHWSYATEHQHDLLQACQQSIDSTAIAVTFCSTKGISSTTCSHLPRPVVFISHRLAASFFLNILVEHRAITGLAQCDVWAGSSTICIWLSMAIEISSTKLWELCPSKINIWGLSLPIFWRNDFSNHSLAIPCLVLPDGDTLNVDPSGALCRSNPWRNLFVLPLAIMCGGIFPLQHSRPLQLLWFVCSRWS